MQPDKLCTGIWKHETCIYSREQIWYMTYAKNECVMMDYQKNVSCDMYGHNRLTFNANTYALSIIYTRIKLHSKMYDKTCKITVTRHLTVFIWLVNRTIFRQMLPYENTSRKSSPYPIETQTFFSLLSLSHKQTKVDNCFFRHDSLHLLLWLQLFEIVFQE